MCGSWYVPEFPRGCSSDAGPAWGTCQGGDRHGGRIRSSVTNAAMSHEATAYRQLKSRWARGEPTVMDGGIGSELQAMGYPPAKADGPVNFTWGTLGLY